MHDIESLKMGTCAYLLLMAAKCTVLEKVVYHILILVSSICWIYCQRNLVSAGCTLCGNLVFAGYSLWESGVFNTVDILSEESGIC